VGEGDLASQLPACSPVDYFAWGVSELRVRAKYHNKTKALISKIREVMGILARNTVAKACRRFRSRIEAVVTADGSYIIKNLNSGFIAAILYVCIQMKSGWRIGVVMLVCQYSNSGLMQCTSQSFVHLPSLEI
jgi:hypothetical protein